MIPAIALMALYLASDNSTANQNHKANDNGMLFVTFMRKTDCDDEIN
jgi:hypothetical protein